MGSCLQGGSFTNNDILVFKFSSTGLQHWTSVYSGQYNLSDRANDIALDTEGNVYVTGYLTSVFTGKITKRVGVVIKYNQFGGFIWSQQFSFSSFPLDEGVSFAISPSGYIYILANTILDNSKTIAVLKYSLSGGLIWNRFYDSEINSKNDFAAAIALDSSGNVYATGTKNRINPTIIDIVVIKYDSTGILKWSRTFDNASAGSDYAYKIISDEFSTYVLGVSTFGGSNKYVLLKYSQVTSVNNLNEIKTNYALYQNYPNPFNPKTIIQYEIPVIERHNNVSVQLIVYDALGKEVSTLVNERQNAGYYIVEFNGSKFTSGVYSYRLVVNGNIINTRRMILLK